METCIADLSEETCKAQRLLGTAILGLSSAEYLSEWKLLRKGLRNIFRKYHTSTPAVKKELEHLIELHAEMCRIRKDAESKRRHNSFVLMYMADSTWSLSQIAQLHSMTRRAAAKDLDHVLDDLMILAYGIDGLPPQPK